MGSGCGSVGWEDASYTRDLQFEFRHRQIFFIINCSKKWIEKAKFKKKRSRMAQCYKSLLTSNMLTTRPWKYLFYSPVLNLSPDRKLIPKFVRRMRPLAFTCAENVRSPSRRSWHATTTLCRFFQNLRFIDVLWKNGTQRTKYIFSFFLQVLLSQSKILDMRV